MKKYIIILSAVVFLAVPAISRADGTPCAQGNGSGTELCNPIVGASNLPTFGAQILRTFAQIAGIGAIIFVLFSAFRFMTSQGNAEAVDSARRALQWAVSGLVVVILSYAVVIALASFLHRNDINSASYNGNPDVTGINPLSFDTFDGLYITLINGFFGVMGLVGVLVLIINGVRYITARGNEEQAESAKSGITYAVLGIVIALLAYVIVRATATFFGGG